MNNSLYAFPRPKNEPVWGYAPGTEERKKLKEALEKMYKETIEIPVIIGGQEIKTGETGKVIMPTEKDHVLATFYKVTEKDVEMAIEAAMKAHEEWANTPWVDRASVILKIATLISGKYRYILNAACMLGQGIFIINFSFHRKNINASRN